MGWGILGWFFVIWLPDRAQTRSMMDKERMESERKKPWDSREWRVEWSKDYNLAQQVVDRYER